MRPPVDPNAPVLTVRELWRHMSATQIMREQRVLALVLIVGAFCAAAPAQALRRCAPKNARVIVQNAFVQAFSPGRYGDLEACLRSTGKTEVLADEGWMD